MSFLAPSTSCLQSTERVGRGATSGKRYALFISYIYRLVSKYGPEQSPHTASIHILDDDSLLNVFYLYRPFLLGEDDEDEESHFWGGGRRWVRGRWWYRLAHVCQRWRNVLLGSATYLDLSLVCTMGTPVADMLAHSPPLPLVIDYDQKSSATDATAEDEEGALLAFKQRDRVHRVRLLMPVANLQKLVAAMDGEYPILEYLVIWNLIEDNSSILTIPETLQAPHIRLLSLTGFALPIRSQLLANAVSLITLSLAMNHPSTYLRPNILLQWLSSMPQLENLAISLAFPVPNRDVERQLSNTPYITPVTLSVLRFFRFRGASTYLEALVHQINTPLLKKLQIFFYNQLTVFIPRLRQFMNTTENLSLVPRFENVKFEFFDKWAFVALYPRGEVNTHAFSIKVDCRHLDWQVSSMAEISNSLSQVFSAVENLILTHEEHSQSSEEHNEVDRTEWRKLFRPFSNAKGLWVDDGLVGEVTRCLQSEDGELSLEALPELRKIAYAGSGKNGDKFTSFIDARRNADRPITLIHPPSPSPDPSSSVIR